MSSESKGRYLVRVSGLVRTRDDTCSGTTHISHWIDTNVHADVGRSVDKVLDDCIRYLGMRSYTRCWKIRVLASIKFDETGVVQEVHSIEDFGTGFELLTRKERYRYVYKEDRDTGEREVSNQSE